MKIFGVFAYKSRTIDFTHSVYVNLVQASLKTLSMDEYFMP